MRLDDLTGSKQFQIQSFSIIKDPPSLYYCNLMIYNDGAHWHEYWYPNNISQLYKAKGWWKNIYGKPGRDHIMLYNWLKRNGKLELI